MTLSSTKKLQLYNNYMYIPSPRSSLTLAWVGFVLCSPVALGCGTKET